MLLAMTCGCSTDPTGVHDPAGLLSADQKSRIEQLHQVLLDELDTDFSLVISDSPVPEIDRDAAQWFNKHRVGRNSSKNKGVLLLVDPIQQQVRIEISYSLEPVFPDSFVGYIQRRQMLPYFNTNQIGHGIEAATELLVARVMNATDGESFDPIKEIGPGFLSGGAGADIGYGTSDTLPRPAETGKQVSAQPSPEAALEAYKKILADHNKRADLGLYSPESRIFFSKWTVTDAQFDNVLQELLSQEPEKIIIHDSRAVIRYPVMQRALSPFLLIRSDEGWMFDFATMNRVIGMNHKNQWHFLHQNHPYMFGFMDLHFDNNGFPFQ